MKNKGWSSFPAALRFSYMHLITKSTWEFMMLTYLVVSGICLISGILSGMAGFGALIIMVPALLLMMGIDVIVPLSVFCGIATQGLTAFSFRRHIRKDSLARLLIGSLPGIWLGSSLLLYLPEIMLRAAMGVLLICYVFWSVFSKLSPPVRPPAAGWAYVTGFFCGAFGEPSASTVHLLSSTQRAPTGRHKKFARFSGYSAECFLSLPR